MKSSILKGYWLTILSTLAFSNVYVFSKAALNEVSLPLFLFVAFGVGFGVNLVLFFISGKNRPDYRSVRGIWWVFPLLGLLESFTVSTFYASVNAITEPSVTGFLGNLFPLFTTILGFLFLKERFTLIESGGVLLVFAGAVVTGYSGNLSLSSFFIPGAGLVVLNCLGAATATVIVRAKVDRIPPATLSLNRTFWLLLFSSVWFFSTGEALTLSGRALMNISAAAILDPVLAILLAYKAYQYIEASRGTIIQSLKGLIIIPFAYICFGTLPFGYQIVGGIIATAGVMIMAFAQQLWAEGQKGKHTGK